MNIPQEYQSFVASQVQFGFFKTPDEVMQEALRRMKLEAERGTQLNWLRTELDGAWAESQKLPLHSPADVSNYLNAKLAE